MKEAGIILRDHALASRGSKHTEIRYQVNLSAASPLATLFVATCRRHVPPLTFLIPFLLDPLYIPPPKSPNPHETQHSHNYIHAHTRTHTERQLQHNTRALYGELRHFVLRPQRRRGHGGARVRRRGATPRRSPLGGGGAHDRGPRTRGGTCRRGGPDAARGGDARRGAAQAPGGLPAAAGGEGRVQAHRPAGGGSGRGD